MRQQPSHEGERENASTALRAGEGEKAPDGASSSPSPLWGGVGEGAKGGADC